MPPLHDDEPDDYDSYSTDDYEDGVADEENAEIECPHCGSALYDDAEQCPHCGMYLSDEDSPRPKLPWWVWLGLIGAALAILSWFAF